MTLRTRGGLGRATRPRSRRRASCRPGAAARGPPGAPRPPPPPRRPSSGPARTSVDSATKTKLHSMANHSESGIFHQKFRENRRFLNAVCLNFRISPDPSDRKVKHRGPAECLPDFRVFPPAAACLPGRFAPVFVRHGVRPPGRRASFFFPVVCRSRSTGSEGQLPGKIDFLPIHLIGI